MQRENKWQDRAKEQIGVMFGSDKIDKFKLEKILSFIQSEIDMAIAEERERTLREIHKWAYKKGGEVPFEERKGFKAVVDYTKHHFKYNKKYGIKYRCKTNR